MPEKFYITTPIYYVNDKPHIGHAYTTIVADVLARHYRQKIGEDNVYFLTGTDEHGAKIAEAASKSNISPQEFTDQITQEFKDAWAKLDISHDDFIRTTEDRHKKIVIDILEKLKAAGALYEADYEGLYCVGCEKFLTEADLVDGKCPDHDREPEQVTEKNWFFKLSDYLPDIKKKIESDELKIYPVTRKNEVLGLIKQGIPDFSISRSNKSVPWGIDLPWDAEQKAYVWVDALSNYITALGYPDGKLYQKFWPAKKQLLALDILKFHTLYWPAILMALDVELPKELDIHGFFTINGQKMSKTLGNVISPNELVEKYGSEVTKYLILSQFSFGSESDIRVDHFTEKYNADLVNGLGNLVNRVTNMIEKYLDGKIDKLDTTDFVEQINSKIESLKFREALLDIWKLIQDSNHLVDDAKPWDLAKNNENDKIKEVLQILANKLYNIAMALESFMPDTSKKIIDIITADKISKPDKPLFPRLNN